MNKNEIIETAIAGELLGKQLIYLESGSGANSTIKNNIINAVKKQISIPIIIGGGINTLQKAKSILKSNPDYIVIGNALEIRPTLLKEINTLFFNNLD